MSGKALRLLRVGITVADLARAEAFYRDALGFEPAGDPREAGPDYTAALGLPDARATVLRMRLGAQEIELAAFTPPGRPYPEGSASTDLWFQHIAIVVGDMAAAHARAAHVAATLGSGAAPITEGGPQRLPPSSGGVTAWKFRDPEGHPLELIAFPSGGGPETWREIPRDALTVGIDHSAISVADAGRSAAFYGDVLGLSVASREVNRGPEQERLDAVPGAVVDVVALAPPDAATPHVELLGYREPRGRPIPADLRANDVAATRLIFETDEIPALAKALGVEDRLVGPGAPYLLGRDPDGHLLVFAEPF
jgi:catechol 2,3-dioxygenase-like lactoylglutathione lyase family enzyme